MLSEAATPPPGTLGETYVHHNAIRRLWPSLLDSVKFIAIAPHASLADRLADGAGLDEPERFLVCGLDESKARNFAADLKALFPESPCTIEPRTPSSPARLPCAGPEDVLLVSPRVWGQLDELQRSRVVHIRHGIRTGDLERLGLELG